MGAGKTIYTTLGVLAILISLTTTATGVLMVLDASKINVVPPDSGNTTFSYDPTPPGKLNVSFPITITYNGSFYSFNDINLTIAIYANAEGIGSPLVVNTTFLTLGPHSTVTINYAFAKTSVPMLTHLSIRTIAKGVMTLASVSFMGFGLDMLYTLF